ncbi:proline-rich protein 15 [Camelus ferus]|uniref:Proline-rich protein 15 n=6 Tax=Camelus TaxID=9836 RepID=A0A8B8TC34_CAMFR|nr:proline-rich protein 15 [Camelus ferus]XP_032339693.1 proline-rich protein 15 [Camelus ferus]XP_032339694.1 proline-rich protein 15 [Camelus ferus]XP_032339695.1 proline-rich protein 15 [Camelus ferus]XP_032339696.1 proline-rich protein 15 [Camelus ferus]XP_032339697.1 proline-rich protein 15 [Camelus ferus]
MADGGGSSSSSSGSWWTSLTSSRKKSKYTLGAAQPSAQPAPGEPAPSGPDWTSGSQENQHPNLLGGAGEPHRPDKMCEEKSGNSRRNLKISRSGRFKEKRKVRATLLPEGVRSSEEAGSPGDPHDSKQ